MPPSDRHPILRAIILKAYHQARLKKEVSGLRFEDLLGTGEPGTLNWGTQEYVGPFPAREDIPVRTQEEDPTVNFRRVARLRAFPVDPTAVAANLETIRRVEQSFVGPSTILDVSEVLQRFEQTRRPTTLDVVQAFIPLHVPITRDPPTMPIRELTPWVPPVGYRMPNVLSIRRDPPTEPAVPCTEPPMYMVSLRGHSRLNMNNDAFPVEHLGTSPSPDYTPNRNRNER